MDRDPRTIYPERAFPDLSLARDREIHRERRTNHTGLSETQAELLRELATFRTIAPGDLPGSWRPDAIALRRSGLIQEHALSYAQSGRSYRVLTLPGALTKPREAPHDIAVYRLYLEHKRAIESQGGRIISVRTEAALRSAFWRRIPNPYDRRDVRIRRKAAKEEALPMVEDRVLFPDLRLEVETHSRERETLDLELATGGYSAGTIAAKQAAGFLVSGPNSHLGGVPRNEYHGWGI